MLAVKSHLKLNGASREQIVLPTDYINEVIGKINVTQDALKLAQSNLERARQMEREYLYLACNGKYSIEGLGNDIVTKICTWRGQFKEPYEKALAKYTSEMDKLKIKQKLRRSSAWLSDKLMLQQKQLQQQQSQIEAQQLTNTLNQIGAQMQSAGQQMLRNVNNQSAPLVNFAPFTAPENGNSIRCVTVGAVTNCR